MTGEHRDAKKGRVMESLVGMDAAFLSLETPTTPMHVGVALVLDPPEGARSLFSPSTRYAQIRRVIQQRLHLIAPLRQRALRVPFGCTTRSGSTIRISIWTTISAGPACPPQEAGPSSTPLSPAS